MKILSINSEHTHGERHIAFNVDKELTPELMALLEYGHLTLTAKGSILIVEMPEDSNEWLDSDFLESLQDKIDSVLDTLEGAQQKRLRMQQRIAQRIGLTLN